MNLSIFSCKESIGLYLKFKILLFFSFRPHILSHKQSTFSQNSSNKYHFFSFLNPIQVEE